MGKAIEAIYATAIVEPVIWSEIAPIKTGRITSVSVQEGDIVHSGDILAQLDDADLRAQVEEQEALAEYYEENLKRSALLLKKGYDSQEKYDARKADLLQTKARISMYEEQIRQLALIAPIDGTVLWRDVDPGEVKQAGAPLFWIGNPKPLQLVAEIDEKDIPKIKAGQNTLITADAFPKRIMTGKIKKISPKGDPVNKSYRVYVELPENIPLMIGMTVETNTIIQEKSNVLLIASGAVTENSTVWLAVNEGTHIVAKNIPVETGIRGTDHTEIISGLFENDQVILPPYNGLKDGKKIRAK